MKKLIVGSSLFLLALGTWACQSTGADQIRHHRGPTSGILWQTDVYTVSATPSRIEGDSVVIDSVDVLGRDSARGVELKLTVVVFEDLDGDSIYDPQQDRVRRTLTGLSPSNVERPPCIGIFGVSTPRAERLMAWIAVDTPGHPVFSAVLPMDGSDLILATKPS